MTDQALKTSRRQMSVMFAIGIVPLIFAYVVYNYFPEVMPTSTTNVGTFLSPPVQADQSDIKTLHVKWSLLVPVNGQCDAACERRFYFARQVNVALGKESERVGRIFVADESLPAAQISRLMGDYPDMQLQQVDMNKLQSWLDKQDVSINPNEYVFFMDPIGNIILYYSLEQAEKGMLKDIKHLLKVSNIG